MSYWGIISLAHHHTLPSWYHYSLAGLKGHISQCILQCYLFSLQFAFYRMYQTSEPHVTTVITFRLKSCCTDSFSLICAQETSLLFIEFNWFSEPHDTAIIKFKLKINLHSFAPKKLAFQYRNLRPLFMFLRADISMTFPYITNPVPKCHLHVDISHVI